MSKTQDRRNIVSEINRAAILYKQNLVGRRFLYVFDGRYIEVLFKAENFKHLTGVATDFSARRFYNYAVNQTLSARQIWFDANHPYDLCVRKARHLCQIACLASSESFILEELTTERRIFKFGATDLNFTLCLDMECDTQGNLVGDCYIVESLRDEDCFSRSKNAYEVTHILSRRNDEKKYAQVLFMDKKSSLKDVPLSVMPMLSPDLLNSDG